MKNLNLGLYLLEKKVYGLKNNGDLDAYAFLAFYRKYKANLFKSFTKEQSEKLDNKLMGITKRLIIIRAAYNKSWVQDIPSDACITSNIVERFRTAIISQESLRDYKETKLYIDILIKIINTSIRDYFYTKTISIKKNIYAKYCLKTKQEVPEKPLTKKELNRKKKIEKEKGEREKLKIETAPKDNKYIDIISTCSLEIFKDDKLCLSYHLKTYQISLNPINDIKINDNTNIFNFISFLDSYTKDEYNLMREISNVEHIYMSKYNNQDAKISLQTTQYLTTICIYIMLMEKLTADTPDFNLKDFFNIREDHILDDDQNLSLIPIKYIFISLSINQEINESVINRYIALLNQMESFYFNKLIYILEKY